MSLALTVTHATGVDVTFWTLNSVYLDAVAQHAVIKMDGYISSEARTNGNSPLTTQDVPVTFVPTNVLTGVSVIQALYAKAQLDPFFAEAVYTNDGI